MWREWVSPANSDSLHELDMLLGTAMPAPDEQPQISTAYHGCVYSF